MLFLIDSIHRYRVLIFKILDLGLKFSICNFNNRINFFNFFLNNIDLNLYNFNIYIYFLKRKLDRENDKPSRAYCIFFLYFNVIGETCVFPYRSMPIETKREILDEETDEDQLPDIEDKENKQPKKNVVIQVVSVVNIKKTQKNKRKR